MRRWRVSRRTAPLGIIDMHRRIPLALATALLASLVPIAAQHGMAPPTEAAVAPARNASRAEVGRPFLTCFGSREYGASAQNWVFAEDTRGLRSAMDAWAPG